MKRLILSISLVLFACLAFGQNMPAYWVPTSGTNAYTTNITGFTAGYTFKVAWVSFTNGNTDASTIVIGPNNVSAAPIRKWDGDSWEPLVPGDIPTITGGARAILTYNNTGSFFELNLLADTGSSGTVESVTGQSVDNTDPTNPIVNAWPLGGTEPTGFSSNVVIPGNGFNVTLGQSGDRAGDFRVWSSGTARVDGSTAAGLQSAGDVDMTSNAGILKLGATGHVITDNNVTKKGLQTAASGYVTDPRSYTDKEYVDAADDLKTNLAWTDNEQTTNYTAVLTDVNKVIQMNSASALNFTVPPNASVAFPIGTYLVVRQKGAGTVTVVPGSGVTVTQPAGGTLDTPGQGLSVTLHKTGTNTWDLENGSPGTGGAATWGAITGTLSDQTDLQAALNAKAPLASPALTGTPTAPTASAGTNNTQIATTAYADAAVAGANTVIKWKSSVKASSTTNGALATAYENGDIIDGITLVTGDRILIQFQTTRSENGIYVVAASGAPTRDTDADISSEFEGMVVLVQQGNLYRNTVFQQITDGVTLGTSSIVFTRISVPYVTPEMFGAVGDGTTDDQAALQAAINTGFSVIFDGSKNYRVNTQVQIPDNTVIEGNGATVSTTSNIHVFYIYTMGENSYINNVNFLGNNTGAGQLGINLSTYRAKVTNCTFRNFNYAGMYVVTTAGAADYEGGVQIANCYFENNNGRGLYLYTTAEYNNVVNCTSRGNGYGLTIRGGNNNWVGGKITDNTVGVELVNGSNDGHGSVTGALINHNGTNVSAVSVTNGFLFANNMFYAGQITLTTNTGIRFDGNEFGGTGGVITLTNNTITEFSNNKFVTDFTVNVTGTNAKWFNNTFNTGTIPAAVTNSLVGKLDLTANIQSGLTSAGTYTTTSNTQQHVLINPTVTTRATTSDQFSAVRISPSITAGAASQTFYTLDVDGSGMLTTNSPTKVALNVRGGAYIATDASAISSYPTLTVNAATQGVISEFRNSGTSIFSISSISASTVATIAGAGSNALGFTGSLVTSGGSSAIQAINATTTAGANNDILRMIRGFNTWALNTRTGVKTYAFHYNPTVTVSTGTHTGHYGFVADNTLYTTPIRNGFNASADPTAQLHIGASTTAAGTASIKINEGSAQTTPEDGTINYVNNNLEFTETSTTYILGKGLGGSATLDFPSISAGGVQSLTITVTGAADGDEVYPGIPNAAFTAGLVYTMRVSATNTVTVDVYNSTGSPIDPASATFKAFVLKR